jgi:signal peptidase I
MNEGEIIIFQAETFDRLLIKRISKVESGKFYVLGDNLSNSEDSRNPMIGWVPQSKVRGKAIFRIYPFDRWGDLGGN